MLTHITCCIDVSDQDKYPHNTVDLAVNINYSLTFDNLSYPVILNYQTVDFFIRASLMNTAMYVHTLFIIINMKEFLRNF